MAAYSARAIMKGAPLAGGAALGAWEKPRETTRSITSGNRSALATPSMSELPETTLGIARWGRKGRTRGR
eukprot:582766-Prymnesium_polylepis.1